VEGVREGARGAGQKEGALALGDLESGGSRGRIVRRYVCACVCVCLCMREFVLVCLRVLVYA
jgi:hypothetical protein